MDLMDLLRSANGGGSVGTLSKQLGLDAGATQNVIQALGPALMRGVQKQTEQSDTMDGLSRALASGRHQQYVDKPNLLAEEATRVDGNKILGHLFGSKDVSRNVAADAAAQTGIDSGLMKKALPMLASLAMGALSKKGAEAGGGSDPGILGGLLGGILGGGAKDSPLDDLLSLGRKLF